MLLLLLVLRTLFLVKLIGKMKFSQFKSIWVFSNGGCFFSKNNNIYNNNIKNKLITILEKDSKNLKSFNKIGLKNFSFYKTKYTILSKYFFLNAINIWKYNKNITNHSIRAL